MKLTIFLLLAAAAACRAQEGPAPLDEDEAKKVIADVRARAVAYSKELPNFVCTQVTRKNVDSTGTRQHWKLVDTYHEELRFEGDKEEYREISLNGKNTGGDNRGNGMPSSLEFSNLMSWVFDPKYNGLFSWSKWDSLRGHRVHELGFAVKKTDSQLTIGKKTQIQCGMIGVADADSDTGSVMRIAVVAADIPKNFPIQGVSMDLHYDFAKIGDHYYLLPLKGDLQSKEGKALYWTEVEFRDYHKP